VKQFYRAIFEIRDTRSLIEWLTPDFEFRSCDGVETGRGEFMEYIRILLDAFPDLRLQIRWAIPMSGALAVRWQCKGTNRGWAAGVAPSGRCIAYEGVALFRIARAKIQRLDCFADAWHSTPRTWVGSDGNRPEIAEPLSLFEHSGRSASSPAELIRSFATEVLEAGEHSRLSSLTTDSFLFITPQFSPARLPETQILLAEWCRSFLPRTVKVENCVADAANAVALIHVRARYAISFSELGRNLGDTRVDFRAALVAQCENRRIRTLEAFYNPERMWKTGLEIGE